MELFKADYYLKLVIERIYSKKLFQGLLKLELLKVRDYSEQEVIQYMELFEEWVCLIKELLKVARLYHSTQNLFKVGNSSNQEITIQSIQLQYRDLYKTELFRTGSYSRFDLL